MGTPIELHFEVARRLVAQDRSNGGNAPERAAAAARVYEALVQSFVPVIGASGVRAVFARSLKLAKGDFPVLGQILPVEPPATTAQVAEQLIACLSGLEPAAVSIAATGLFANVFGLMSKFIGERVAWQIVKSAFPGIDATKLMETEQ